MNDQELLNQLLSNPLPSREGFCPVALRSVDEQRRLAFKPFLQRTWIDQVLHILERVMVFLVIGFFVFWVIDGYGRDWLYQWQQNPSTGPSGMLIPSLSHAGQAVLTDAAPALPFTTPDMQQEMEQGSYLVPQSIAVAPEPVDLRPSRLQIPAIQLDTPVVEVFLSHGAWQVANYAAGYHHGSALPGEPGNVVMAGHAGLRGAVFRHLDQLQPGDTLIVDAGAWQYVYLVRESLRVWPTQVEVMAQGSTPTLTLITCTDWDARRLVVVADLAGAHPLSDHHSAY